MWAIDKAAEALEFATRFHGNQTFGGRLAGERVAYVSHLASVAMEILWAANDTPHWDMDLALRCAVLHDVIEDTEATFESVRNEFGIAVANGVMALTKNESLPSRAEQMADSLRRILLQPPEIWGVKMADRITNLYHAPYYWKDDRIEEYRSESRTILSSLGAANMKLANRLKEKIDLYGKLGAS